MDENILLQTWASLYQAALSELDPHNLVKRIDAAENAMKERLHELRERKHCRERESIQKAQNALRFLRPDGPTIGPIKEIEIMREKASATLSGTVDKVIPSLIPSKPDTAQITVEGADDLYREIRVENTLKDAAGREVSLKQGAHVEVTVEAEPSATTLK